MITNRCRLLGSEVQSPQVGLLSALADQHAIPMMVHKFGWSLGNSYRNGLITKGDLTALWVTGPTRPGIYEVGRISSKVMPWNGLDRRYAIDLEKAAQPCDGVDFNAVWLGGHTYLPRHDLSANPILRNSEQFRQPRVSNPSYLTVEETRALANLLSARVPKARLKEVGWDKASS
ncbi:hypothetical protein GXW84_27035 [Rhodococcus sp. IEGM 248]|nr:hypothetical protein [Rhodococcus sp. IEGM 248]